eukprot:810172-Karenia_brevis.AAC.1
MRKAWQRIRFPASQKPMLPCSDQRLKSISAAGLRKKRITPELCQAVSAGIILYHALGRGFGKTRHMCLFEVCS